MAKISVIVPVYKVEKYLARCVDSILAQTFSDYELILVDDGSPDNCPKMCDEYAAKYSFIKVIHKENGGLSDARNFGIEYALTTDSEWLTFIDSDDWVHPQYLEILYNACIENNVNISCCGIEKVVDNETKNQILDDKYAFNVYSTEIYFYHSYYFTQNQSISIAPARLYKKDLWEEIRFPIGRFHEDEFTTYKVLFQTGKIIETTVNLYYYYQNNSGIMAKLSRKRIIDRIEAVYEQAIFFATRKYGKAYAVTLERLCFHYFLDYYRYRKDKIINAKFIVVGEYIKKSSKLNKGLLSLSQHYKLINKYKRNGRLNFKKYCKKCFLTDLKRIKIEKGVISSLLWAIKNIWFYNSEIEKSEIKGIYEK